MERFICPGVRFPDEFVSRPGVVWISSAEARRRFRLPVRRVADFLRERGVVCRRVAVGDAVAGRFRFLWPLDEVAEAAAAMLPLLPVGVELLRWLDVVGELGCSRKRADGVARRLGVVLCLYWARCNGRLKPVCFISPGDAARVRAALG